MFIFPVRTDLRRRHVPWVNGALIVINVIIFLAQVQAAVAHPHSDQWYAHYMLNPAMPQWYQFFTYQFLHSGWEHLILNMIFLFVFGNPMEDRFGPLGYALFYLAGGVVAGLCHVMFATSPAAPVWGASGAISAVAGAFFVLFPFSRVTLSFYFVESFDVSGYILVLFNFARDLMFQLLGYAGVAYMAHLGGNVFGFVVAMGLLGIGVLKREPYDLLSLWARLRGGRSLRQAISESERIHEQEQHAPDGDPEQALTRALAAQDVDGVVTAYRRLTTRDDHISLGRQVLLDVAHHAMNHQQYEIAADAYERFLAEFTEDSFGAQVQLMLGLIYARQLHQPQLARQHLTIAAAQLTDPHRKRQAEDVLAQLTQSTK